MVPTVKGIKLNTAEKEADMGKIFVLLLLLCTGQNESSEHGNSKVTNVPFIYKVYI